MLNFLPRNYELKDLVEKTISEKLGTLIERLNTKLAYNYYYLSLNKKNLKPFNIYHSFTSRQVIKIVKDFENDCYRLYFDKKEYRNVKENEMLAIYKPVRVNKKIKKNPIDNNMRYAIALIRKSRKGNDRFLHRNGRFNASYANRCIYKTLKGAESCISRIYRNNEIKPNTLKVVACYC